MTHSALTDLGFTDAEKELLEHTWNSGLLDFLLNDDATFMRNRDATLAETLDWPHHGVDLADATVFGVNGFTPQQTHYIWSGPPPADEGESLWWRYLDGPDFLGLDLPPYLLAFAFATSDSVEKVMDWNTKYQRAHQGQPQEGGQVITVNEVENALRFLFDLSHPTDCRCRQWKQPSPASDVGGHR